MGRVPRLLFVFRVAQVASANTRDQSHGEEEPRSLLSLVG